MLRLDGRELSKQWREGLKVKVADFQTQWKSDPCLAVVLVGEDPASQVYVSHKIKACKEVGITSLEHRLPSNTTQAELEGLIEKLNQDPMVNGILVQLPLPDQLDEAKAIAKVSPMKDADGLTIENLGLLVAGKTRVAPCTPFGVIQLLKQNNIEIAGKNAVVVGRSQIVGKPMAMLLLAENATVTICHSRTKNLQEHLKAADIVVVAAGKPRFLGKDDFSEGSVIVDVGIHRQDNGKLCGDVRFDELTDTASAMTPVPGGVGPMTIAMLLENTLNLARLQREA